MDPTVEKGLHHEILVRIVGAILPQAVKNSGEQNGVELNWLREVGCLIIVTCLSSAFVFDLDTARPPWC
jgi:hypothetical protein